MFEKTALKGKSLRRAQTVKAAAQQLWRPGSLYFSPRKEAVVQRPAKLRLRGPACSPCQVRGPACGISDLQGPNTVVPVDVPPKQSGPPGRETWTRKGRTRKQVPAAVGSAGDSRRRDDGIPSEPLEQGPAV